MAKRLITGTLAGFFFTSLFFMNLGTGYASSEELHPGSADNVQMLQQPLNDIDAKIDQALDKKVMPGAVTLVARNGTIVKHDAYGYAARYTDDNFTEMDNPVQMQKDTIFDLASVSKLFTVTAAMQLWDQGRFSLDDPVADYIPEFADNGKGDVTIRQLMTHTSGFKPWVPLYTKADTREEAINIVLDYPLKHEPGTHYAYSDLNMIALGVLVERLTGQREDIYVKQHITNPLNMTDTMYNPSNSLHDRIAATEYQPYTNRGMVWGSVHDENAWVLDGVAGHAGVFSTARDLAIFGQMMLNKGTYRGERILSKQAVQLMNKNWNKEFPGQDHGLGWELNQEWYMGGLANSNTMGHTGFTGTSIVISPKKDAIAILLTNRVHPTRDTPSTNPIRRKVASKTADAINAWSADTMKTQVKHLDKKGAFNDDRAVHSLMRHLTAVSHYEKKGVTNKVIKHLEGFNDLLDHQKNNKLISDDAYQTLTTDTTYLIRKRKQD